MPFPRLLATGSRAATLTLAAFLAGWGLATWGLAWAFRATWLWPLSGGLLLLGLAGYRPHAIVLWRGWASVKWMGDAVQAARARQAGAGVAGAVKAEDKERARVAELAQQKARAAAELSGEPISPEEVLALTGGRPKTGRR